MHLFPIFRRLSHPPISASPSSLNSTISNSALSSSATSPHPHHSSPPLPFTPPSTLLQPIAPPHSHPSTIPHYNLFPSYPPTLTSPTSPTFTLTPPPTPLTTLTHLPPHTPIILTHPSPSPIPHPPSATSTDPGSDATLLTLSNYAASIPRILSYNINSLSYYSTNPRSNFRRHLISSFIADNLSKFEIICLQETNLARSEQHAMTHLPGCVVSLNNLKQDTAGTLIIDTPAVRKHYIGADVPLPDICKGRVQLRRYTSRDSSHPNFQLFNFYLVSGGDFTTNSSIISSLLSLPPFPSFVCGDLNFIERDQDSSSANPVLPNKEFSDRWHEFLDRFGCTELPSDAHTFFHITEDPLSPHSRTSRLDRIYVPSSLTNDPLLSCSIYTPHHHSNLSFADRHLPNHGLSDHLPIAISYNNNVVRKKKSRSIPRWVADSSSFLPLFEKVWHPPSTTSPFNDLISFKNALYRAADLTKLFTTPPAVSNLLLSQHLSLNNLINTIPQNTSRIDSLLLRNPALKDLVCRRDGIWFPAGLVEATKELMLEKPTPHPKPFNLVRDMALSLPSNRKKAPSLRTLPEDPPVFSSAGKTEVAKKFWSQFWRRRADEAPKTARDDFLKGYYKKVKTELCSRPSLLTIESAIKTSNDSASGPDGIPFAAWRAVLPLAAPVLLSALNALLSGQTPPPGFNLGVLFLIPKKLTGLISDTRPISVTNSDNRILASVMAKSIVPAVSDLVNPEQRGFLAGVSGEKHIVDINKIFYDAVKEKKKSTKLLFLLDTAKAFDSIDHSWITAVLARVGFPPWVRNFVKGSLSNVKVAPFFGDGLLDWISIDRGVKQGCPLSPLLFIIAYDPLIFHLARDPNIKLFVFADDIAIITNSVSDIAPSLLLITSFSNVSGLGINKSKSMVIPSCPPEDWALIQEQLRASSWPDLTVQAAGTHLGILIGRDVTLEDIWKGPITKASDRIRNCSHIVKNMSIRYRIIFINTFIVSIFSYISLFFILPPDLWGNIKSLISKAIIPFNGGAYSYFSLICADYLYGVKPALKDVWAFNISLLAARSSLFHTTPNYHDLPYIKTKFNLHISSHRDAAAIDLWRSRHLPDGTLLPVVPPTSSNAYKVIVGDVYLQEAALALGNKVSSFLFRNPSPLFPTPFTDPSSLSSSLASSLSSATSLPVSLLFFHMTFVNNALPSSRRTRHQFNIDLEDVPPCFYCNEKEDSIQHIYAECPVILQARFAFLSSFGFASSSFHFPQHPPLSFSFLISCPTILVKHVISFNFAVWKYRKPAQASNPENTREWLINRITELAKSSLAPRSKKASKKKHQYDPLADAALHNKIILNAPISSAFCYTDGSASPNPGPCGSGVSFFLPARDLILDMGSSLGVGSNNYAELYALGMALSYIPLLVANHRIDSVYLFSDSKLALNAATSNSASLAHPVISASLKKLYRTALEICSLELHWIRGHSAIGGNERVDRISKNFATSSSTPAHFSLSFPCIERFTHFPFHFPIIDLPISFFHNNALSPRSLSPAEELDYKHND